MPKRLTIMLGIPLGIALLFGPAISDKFNIELRGVGAGMLIGAIVLAIVKAPQKGNVDTDPGDPPTSKSQP